MSGLCPQCKEHLGGVADWCFRCQEYTADMGASGTNAKQAPLSSREAPFVSANADPVLIVFPWSLMVSKNNWQGGMVGCTTREWRECRDAMKAEVAIRMRDRASLEGVVIVHMDYYPPDRRRRDYHNLQQALLDALEGPEGIRGVYPDDAAVHHWEGHVHPVSDNPRCEVRCEQMREAV